MRVKKLRTIVEEANNEKLAKILQDYPALAKSKTDGGITLLQWAAYCKNQVAMALLRKFKRRLTLFEAISMGDLDLVVRALDRNPARKDSFSPDGFTPLGLSAYFGHLDIVTHLLSLGANTNIAAKNEYQVTPLHSACSIGHFAIAKLLVENGADVNAQQMRGVTALHSAAHNGDLAIVELLLNNGADANAKMDTGETPLMMAKASRKRKVASFIRGFGGV